MEYDETVKSLNVNDLTEYSPERQVRKKFVQSMTIVSEVACYEPGQMTKMHVHPHQDEIFFCVEGAGAITFEDRDAEPMAPGSVVFVPAGIRHGVSTGGGERLVLMFTKGPGLPSPKAQRAAETEAQRAAEAAAAAE